MRTEDIGDFFRLRTWVDNPWEVVRFRKRGRPGTELRVDVRDGPPLHLRGGFADFHMFHRIFLRDEYHLADRGRLGCVVDLGANVGLFAARVSRQCERVVSYEPVPQNFAALRRNTADLAGVEAVQAAVAGKSGSLRLFAPSDAGQSGVFSSHPGFAGLMSDESFEVAAVTLEELFEAHAIETCDLLKVDIEGAEYDLFYATPEATLRRIRRIHGEYHDVRPEDPTTRAAHLAAFLERAGFAVRLDPHRRRPNRGMFFAERAD